MLWTFLEVFGVFFEDHGFKTPQISILIKNLRILFFQILFRTFVLFSDYILSKFGIVFGLCFITTLFTISSFRLRSLLNCFWTLSRKFKDPQLIYFSVLRPLDILHLQSFQPWLSFPSSCFWSIISHTVLSNSIILILKSPFHFLFPNSILASMLIMPFSLSVVCGLLCHYCFSTISLSIFYSLTISITSSPHPSLYVRTKF